MNSEPESQAPAPKEFGEREAGAVRLSPEMAREIADEAGLNSMVREAYTNRLTGKTWREALVIGARFLDRNHRDERKTGLNMYDAFEDHIAIQCDAIRNRINAVRFEPGTITDRNERGVQRPFSVIYDQLQGELSQEYKDDLDQRLAELDNTSLEGELLAMLQLEQLSEAYVRSEMSRIGFFYGDMVGLKAANTFNGEKHVDEYGFAKWGRYMQVLSSITQSDVYKDAVKKFDSQATLDYQTPGEPVIVPLEEYVNTLALRFQRANVNPQLLMEDELTTGRRVSSGDEAIIMYKSNQRDANGRPIPLDRDVWVNAARAIKAASITDIGEYSLEDSKPIYDNIRTLFGKRYALEGLEDNTTIKVGFTMRLGFKRLDQILDLAEEDSPQESVFDFVHSHFESFMAEAEKVMMEEKKKEGIVELFNAINGVQESQVLIEQLRANNRLQDSLGADVNIPVAIARIQALPAEGRIEWQDFVDLVLTPARQENRRGQNPQQ